MLQEICNWIILIAAVGGALITIFHWFVKPFIKIKKKRETAYTRRLKAELINILPELMLDQKKLLEEEIEMSIKNKTVESLMPVLNEIRQQNKDQTTEIIGMKNQVIDFNNRLGVLERAECDVIREKIMEIYNAGKFTRKIDRRTKEILDELWGDYNALHGNHGLSKYYTRICEDWEVIPADD